MGGSRSGYLAYLLRLWRIGKGEGAVWRASLQDVRTGERVGFPGLEEAVAFLQQQLRASAGEGRLPHDREQGDA